MNGGGTLVLKQKKLPVVTFATVLVTIWNISYIYCVLRSIK